MTLAGCVSDRAVLSERCGAADAKASGCTRDLALASPKTAPETLIAPPSSLLVVASDTRTNDAAPQGELASAVEREPVSFGVDPLPVGALTAVSLSKGRTVVSGPAI